MFYQVEKRQLAHRTEDRLPKKQFPLYQLVGLFPSYRVGVREPTQETGGMVSPQSIQDWPKLCQKLPRLEVPPLYHMHWMPPAATPKRPVLLLHKIKCHHSTPTNFHVMVTQVVEDTLITFNTMGYHAFQPCIVIQYHHKLLEWAVWIQQVPPRSVIQLSKLGSQSGHQIIPTRLTPVGAPCQRFREGGCADIAIPEEVYHGVQVCSQHTPLLTTKVICNVNDRRQITIGIRWSTKHFFLNRISNTATNHGGRGITLPRMMKTFPDLHHGPKFMEEK